MILISLIGEQPIPNLLPIRDQPPAAAVLLYSDFTKKTAERLAKLLPAGCVALPWPVAGAYDIESARQDLLCRIQSVGWSGPDLVFNLTGGTKLMSFAAYLVAAELRAPFLYLQSEGKQTRLYRYEFDAAGAPHLVEDRLLPTLITIADYLHAFLDGYQMTGFAKDEQSKGAQFETAIYTALQPAVDEIAAGLKHTGAVDVDFVVRCGNQVGIIEAKTGPGVKKGIDQLNTAGEPRYLGTYTQKLLISDQVWEHTLSNLKELAQARRIEVIELPSFGATGQFTPKDADQLVRTVCGVLGRTRS
jgi:hypothetical protein